MIECTQHYLYHSGSAHSCCCHAWRHIRARPGCGDCVPQAGGSGKQKSSPLAPAAQAREYLAAGDVVNASKLLQSVSVLYRREGWTAALAASLLELRECAQRQDRLRVKKCHEELSKNRTYISAGPMSDSCALQPAALRPLPPLQLEQRYSCRL